MLIGLTLFVMFMLVIFSLILGNSIIGTPINIPIATELIDNGTSTVLEFSMGDGVFGISELSTGLVILTIIVAVAIGITVQVVGTGLSENGSRMVITSVFYGSLWTMLSILAEPLITSIEVFGGMMYMLLTITFVIGVMQSYFGGEG